MDEVGRGPLAGPVVASAVIVRDFSFYSRIDDSKKLSVGQREASFAEILAKCIVSLGVVESAVIDRINIFQATMKAMEQAVSRLADTPDAVLVDGPAKPQLPFQIFPIVNGDALSFSIACASIVAKVTRDRMMDYYDCLYPQYGFSKHKGYGTQGHLEALKKYGPCDIHRKSFEPVKGLWKRF